MAGIEERVKLLWARRRAPAFAQLSSNVTREICLFLPLQMPLVCVDSNRLRFFDFPQESVFSVPLERSIRVMNCSWATVDNNRVVVCEGGANGKTHTDNVLHTVLLLHRSGQVNALPSLIYPHNNPGMVVWRRAVHVFGSFAGPGGERCERMHLGSTWELLPDMHSPRATFTPAIWRDAIYLCAGHSNTSIETFDGVTMRLLEISLVEAGITVTCVRGDTLLVFTRGYLTTLEGTFRPVARVARIAKSMLCPAYTPAVLWNGAVYCASQSMIFKTSPEDGHFILAFS